MPKRFPAMLLALAALAGCQAAPDPVISRCSAAVAGARSGWTACHDEVRQRFARLAAEADARAVKARERLAQIERLQACSQRVANAGPDIPAECLDEAGLERLPSAEDARGELMEEQARLREAQALGDLEGKLASILSMLPCRWEEAVELSRELHAEPACAELAQVRQATEQMVVSCPGQAALLTGDCGRGR
ncbi:MAG TPA: hypothetical protein PK668_25485 [Myxococcota bacterium]|nr:hypothetical protein [Myxococcota bacterium]HRY95224.1 hypothetical protein [Myxococcota bacterium]HSA23532.1 hypothetical protein [Myxococcota bacterium]